jgi:glutaredoxin
VDSRGAQQTIVYGQDHRLTLIYNFSQQCPYCKENWRALEPLQALTPGRLRIVYIDTVGDVFTPKYLAANRIEQSPLLVQLSPAAKYTYEARLMPQVLLVDSKGTVQWSHVGEFAPVDVSKVLSMIGHD